MKIHGSLKIVVMVTKIGLFWFKSLNLSDCPYSNDIARTNVILIFEVEQDVLVCPFYVDDIMAV